MKRFLITGVSSGIGRALARKLVLSGNEVWGISRRKEPLQSLDEELKDQGKFYYLVADVSQEKDWENLITEMSRKKYFPQVIIFNAAIFKPDLEKGLESQLTRETFSVNFFGIIEGIEILLRFAKKGTQFLAISSLSALKGSSVEGIGYPASKAALNIAFESLYQKYKNTFMFKTLSFGPVATGMSSFKKKFPFLLTRDQAVKKIIEVVEGKQVINYDPWFLFFFLRILKLLPLSIYFFALSKIENLHLKLRS